MTEIERQTTLSNIPEDPGCDTVPINFTDAVMSMKEFLLPESSRAWVAPLPPSNFRLIDTYDVLGGPVRKIEILESRREAGPNHARVYFSPTRDHIPTLIIGAYAAVAHCAWQDGRPAFPLSQQTQDIVVGATTVRYPDELFRLPGLDMLLRHQQKLMFMTRWSSYWLQKICMLAIGDLIVKAKVYENHFSQGHSFCHVTSPDEWSRLIPEGLPGVVLTNAALYIQAHQELEFVDVSHLML